MRRPAKDGLRLDAVPCIAYLPGVKPDLSARPLTNQEPS
jgi:hypothetical protein